MADLARKHQRIARQAYTRQIQRVERAIRVAGFGVIVVVVFAVVIYLLSPLFVSQPSGIVQEGNTTTVNVKAAMDGFDIKEIHAKVGETVKVNLRSMDNSMHSDGGGKHQFAIDELGINIVAQPLSLSSGTFTPAKVGVYTFYCDICCGGRANPTMNGKVIVEA
jgi:heme/copper-type cytochrome/quinol oxidase subunit 2